MTKDEFKLKIVDYKLGNISATEMDNLVDQYTDTITKPKVCKHEWVSSVAYKGARVCTKCQKYQ